MTLTIHQRGESSVIKYLRIMQPDIRNGERNSLCSKKSDSPGATSRERSLLASSCMVFPMPARRHMEQ